MGRADRVGGSGTTTLGVVSSTEGIRHPVLTVLSYRRPSVQKTVDAFAAHSLRLSGVVGKRVVALSGSPSVGTDCSRCSGFGRLRSHFCVLVKC